MFQFKPTTNGVESLKPSNPFTFGSTPSTTASASAASSTTPAPSNPFMPTAPSTAANAPSAPSFSTPQPLEDRVLTTDEIERVKGFLGQIETKFQNMERFKEEAKKEFGLISTRPANKNADQAVDDFASQLQRILPDVATGTTSNVTLPDFDARLLFAMMDKHLDAAPKPASSIFAPKPAQNNANTATFAPLLSTNTTANPFAPQKPASPAPSAPAPPVAKNILEIATLREMLKSEAQQQLSSIEISVPTIDAKKIGETLPALFSQSFSSLRPEDLPAGVDMSLLRDAVKEGVTQAFAKLLADKPQTALSEATVRDLFNTTFRNALPTVLAVLDKAVKSSSPTQDSPLEIEAALTQVRTMKAHCLSAQPPTTFSTPPYSLSKLNPLQQAQFTGAWRIRRFASLTQDLLDKFLSDNAATSKIMAEYDRLRMELAGASGMKRKVAPDTTNASESGPNKRPNFGVSAPNGVLFGASTSEKRSADTEESSPFAKRARGESIGSPAPSGSQTSQLFASLTQKPAEFVTAPQTNSASNHFAAAVQTSTTSTHSNAGPSLFASTQTPSKNAPFSAAPSLFAATPQSSNKTAQPVTAPKLPSFGAPASGNSFLAQFGQKASESAAKDKAKRKAEDFDSDEETEEEWEKRDAAEQLAKRQKLLAAATTSGFKPKPSSSEANKESEADNDKSTEEPSIDKSEETNGGDATPKPGSSSRSLFDRVQDASPTITANGDKTWKPDTPIKFGSSQSSNASDSVTSLFGSPRHSSQAAASAPSTGSLFATPAKTLSKHATTVADRDSIFTPSTEGAATNVGAASTTNPTATTAAATAAPPKLEFTAASPQKTANSKSTGLFGFPTTPTPASNTGSNDPPKSLFDTGVKAASAPMANPFAHLAENPSLFNTPPASSSTGGLSLFASAGTSRATSPGFTTGDESAGSGAGEEAPKDPQLDLSESRAGEENEKTEWEVRAKAMELVPKDDMDPQGDKEWTVRGVGPLRVLKNDKDTKARLVLRAGPASRVVLNCSILRSSKFEQSSPKTIKFVGTHAGKLGMWSLMVGKPDDSDKLLKMLVELKDWVRE